ncbi:dirigent protein 1-like [Miscanthus floridulus]|uniref:dirigent protein 1-like n=1 Tax=Miscanthus floridulus TaxID=154761 RepID=UPI003459F9BA
MKAGKHWTTQGHKAAITMAPSSLPHLLFLLALTSSVAVLAAAAAAGSEGDHHGLTHIHLYVHETYTGANATATAVLQSPLGANSSFGSMGVVDDEIRVGPDRSSQLVGRYQGVFFGTSLELGKGYLTSITLVFTAGEYGGSTLSVQGPLLGFTGTIERAVVGGTGKFRLARGYMLFKMISKPTPETDVNEINLFVLMHPAGKY